MTKADRIHKELITEILTEGTWDENPRPRYSDGQPAHTLFITQVTEEYDISLGEFPITQLRPIAYKMGINEALAIYQSQTNTQEGFESHDCRWWLDWMNEEGNLGRAYSYNLESHRPMEMNREIVKVKKRVVDEKCGELKEIKVNEVDLSKSIDGQIYFDKFIVLEDKVYDKKRNRNKKRIQFVDTGYIKLVEDFNYKGGKTPYDRTFAGIGYFGEYKNVPNFKDEHVETLRKRWISMISRCYHNSTSHKLNYKDKGIFVHHDWHSFEQFLRDVRYMPQYHLAKEDDFKGWEIDKDYYGSNAYSKDTCVWLKRSDNLLYRDTMKPFELVDSDEKSKIYLSTIDASRDLECTHQSVEQSLKKGCKVMGYSTRYIEEEDGYLYRKELSRNQINELINGIKNDKFGRRHMLSFYHWANIDKKTLVECAFQSLYSVRKVNNDYILDATLIQRSSDFATASSINCIQYVALQMMLAHECGMKVGKFVRFTQNLHLYDRHIPQAYELLNREAPESNPLLLLNADGKTFYDITVDDFELINYNPIRPQLKFDLGI